LAALEVLRTQGWKIEEEAIRTGLAAVNWPGRFDIVMRRPLTIFDCAHNELAVEALLQTLTVEFGEELRPHLVFGCLEDKRWERMARMLGPRVSSVTLTQAQPKRPLDPARLEPIFKEYAPTIVVRQPSDAIAQVMAQTSENEAVLVTGSVYLVGEIYPWFLARQGRRGLFPEATG
jgi:dihydrofolate synthase/folylpolyglutamate synthase